jgi:hypothetical protein
MGLSLERWVTAVLHNGLGRYQEAFAAASEALRQDPAELWFSPGLEPDRPGNGDGVGVGKLGRGHVSQWVRLGRRVWRDA